MPQAIGVGHRLTRMSLRRFRRRFEQACATVQTLPSHSAHSACPRFAALFIGDLQ